MEENQKLNDSNIMSSAMGDSVMGKPKSLNKMAAQKVLKKKETIRSLG